MGIFSSKTGYLGIDLGTSSIKVVEILNFGGRPRLATYGFTERKSAIESSREAGLDNPAEMAAILKDIRHKARMTSTKAVASLPNFSVFSAILNLPNLPKKELASAIGWEAKKIIPLPIEEMILDWKIIAEEEMKSDSGATGAGILDKSKTIFSRSTKNLKVLLTGASKKLVKKYVDIFSQAGLTLLSLETESFALVRSLVGGDKSVTAVIDLGATTSSISIVDAGIPVLTRSISVGGSMLTKTISTTLNVNFDRAEQFKQDMFLGAETAENSLPQLVEKSFGAILNEIKYTINLYQEQNNKKVEKIVLTGGSALLGNLSGYLSQVLNVNTYIGDPWSRVIYPTELKPILDRLGARFSVAIGLAMREVE